MKRRTKIKEDILFRNNDGVPGRMQDCFLVKYIKWTYEQRNGPKNHEGVNGIFYLEFFYLCANVLTYVHVGVGVISLQGMDSIGLNLDFPIERCYYAEPDNGA